ncbi:MAG: MFS transporter [Clostridiales bacterium]|jgi:MFS family permease|nr:MFS transporter [Eubacteriales bacterium]MDH7567717.1 MFS transporter [Clostridiales bacterium]
MTEQNDASQGKKIAGLERNVFFSGLTSFLTDTTTKMIYCIMPLFLLSIGATKTDLSLIEGIAESTASVLKALSGWWSDKIGKNKPFMVIGYAITTIIAPLYSLAGVPLQILYLRFIERVGKGIRTAPRDSLIAGSSKQKKSGKNFGFHKAMDNCGAIAGPLLAYCILMVFPSEYRKIFLISAIPAFAGVITIIFFIKEAKIEKESLPGKIVLKDFSSRYYIFLFITFIFTLGNSTDALLLVKANDIGINALYIPLVYLIYNSVSVLFAVPMGTLSDKIGRERLIILGYLLYSAVYFGFGRSNVKAVIILLFALYGLYSALTDGVQKALVSDLIHRDKRGTGLGIYNAVLGITLLPASLIAGILYDRVNYSAPFYFGASTALLAAAMMFLFYKVHKGKPDTVN